MLTRLKIWLVLFVAIMLPLRGGLVAAGSFCHDSAQGTKADAVLSATHHADHHQAAIAVDHASGPDGASSERAPYGDSCAHCASGCSVPPLIQVATGVPAPLELAGARLPEPQVAPPSHPSDGVERPPRSI